tara:strand:- start:711 stop:1277 length:567 start_codon:yes stop_codon:yes gene_type:complete
MKNKQSTASKVLTAIASKDLLHKEIRQAAWDLKTNKSRYFKDNRKNVPNGWGSSYVTDFKYMGLIKQVGKKYRITEKGLNNLARPWSAYPVLSHKEYNKEIKKLRSLSERHFQNILKRDRKIWELERKIKELENGQLNKVSQNDCRDAINYLFVNGFVDEMTTDKKYYTTILLKKVANELNIKLEGVE